MSVNYSTFHFCTPTFFLSKSPAVTLCVIYSTLQPERHMNKKDQGGVPLCYLQERGLGEINGQMFPPFAGGRPSQHAGNWRLALIGRSSVCYSAHILRGRLGRISRVWKFSTPHILTRDIWFPEICKKKKCMCLLCTFFFSSHTR